MILYNAGLRLFHFLIRLFSSFDRKAKQFTGGRKTSFELLDQFKNNARGNGPAYWFHCASLGEFEQARPLIEGIRRQEPEARIAVSFFSPSGYEIRKNYSDADVVFYLPMATPANAVKVLDLLRPAKIFFIKYEFWINYIQAAYERNIPVFLVSALFHPGQVFFKPHGKLFFNVLKKYRMIFVQDDASKALLSRYGIQSIVSGDTRFDRVLTNKALAVKNAIVEAFKGNEALLVAGSSWEKEEELLFVSYLQYSGYKLIIAPHDIHRTLHIPDGIKAIRYSQATVENVKDHRVLVIDNIGMLASLYSYATVALVGGGFRTALHNILEAAVFGIPVLYGPRTRNHPEAEALRDAGGGRIIHDAGELTRVLKELMEDAPRATSMGTHASRFITAHAGATEKILSEI
jgi:3-deoxy-D-manno-octulosonic-acid transferase